MSLTTEGSSGSWEGEDGADGIGVALVGRGRVGRLPIRAAYRWTACSGRATRPTPTFLAIARLTVTGAGMVECKAKRRTGDVPAAFSPTPRWWHSDGDGCTKHSIACHIGDDHPERSAASASRATTAEIPGAFGGAGQPMSQCLPAPVTRAITDDGGPRLAHAQDAAPRILVTPGRPSCRPTLSDDRCERGSDPAATGIGMGRGVAVEDGRR